MTWSHPLFDAANVARDTPTVRRTWTKLNRFNTKSTRSFFVELHILVPFLSLLLLHVCYSSFLFSPIILSPQTSCPHFFLPMYMCTAPFVATQVLFEVQWRQRVDSGVPRWEASAQLLRSNTCRKKNLKLSTCYEFRVKKGRCSFYQK